MTTFAVQLPTFSPDDPALLRDLAELRVSRSAEVGWNEYLYTADSREALVELLARNWNDGAGAPDELVSDIREEQ